MIARSIPSSDHLIAYISYFYRLNFILVISSSTFLVQSVPCKDHLIVSQFFVFSELASSDRGGLSANIRLTSSTSRSSNKSLSFRIHKGSIISYITVPNKMSFVTRPFLLNWIGICLRIDSSICNLHYRNRAYI